MTELTTPPQEEAVMLPGAFQIAVGEWMKECFTPAIIADKLERSDRFIEESLELVQACGYSPERAHALVDYVFNRPVGEAFQEVGGVMVTLAALCNPHDLDMEEAAATELARVWTKIDAIRAKQATKPFGSALPIPQSRTPIPDDAMPWKRELYIEFSEDVPTAAVYREDGKEVMRCQIRAAIAAVASGGERSDAR